MVLVKGPWLCPCINKDVIHLPVRGVCLKTVCKLKVVLSRSRGYNTSTCVYIMKSHALLYLHIKVLSLGEKRVFSLGKIHQSTGL